MVLTIWLEMAETVVLYTITIKVCINELFQWKATQFLSPVQMQFSLHHVGLERIESKPFTGKRIAVNGYDARMHRTDINATISITIASARLLDETIFNTRSLLCTSQSPRLTDCMPLYVFKHALL